MHRSCPYRIVAIAPLVPLAANASRAFADGGEAAYVSQERYVHAGACQDDQRADAPDFGVFDVAVEAVGCEDHAGNEVHGLASQYSILEPRLIEMIGGVFGSYLFQEQCSFGTSFLDVGFTVDRPVSFDFDGLLIGGSSLRTGWRVQLFQGSIELFDWHYWDGSPLEWETHGWLSPGSGYRVLAEFSECDGSMDFDWSLSLGERPTLAVSETPCPEGGRFEVEWFDATPLGKVALIFALEEGAVDVRSWLPCAGVELGLGRRRLQVIHREASDGQGQGMQGGTTGPAACGGFVQLLDLTSCAVSNVARVE